MPSANLGRLTKRMADAYFGTGTFKLMLASAAPSESDLDTFGFRSDMPCLRQQEPRPEGPRAQRPQKDSPRRCR